MFRLFLKILMFRWILMFQKTPRFRRFQRILTFRPFQKILMFHWILRFQKILRFLMFQKILMFRPFLRFQRFQTYQQIRLDQLGRLVLFHRSILVESTEKIRLQF
jgi:hypothetical protein